MSKKDEEETVESLGEGDSQALGFQQLPDGHGWSDEEIAAREAANVVEPAPKEESKAKAKPVEMETGASSSGGSK